MQSPIKRVVVALDKSLVYVTKLLPGTLRVLITTGVFRYPTKGYAVLSLWITPAELQLDNDSTATESYNALAH
jgi:hypothetical protein